MMGGEGSRDTTIPTAATAATTTTGPPLPQVVVALHSLLTQLLHAATGSNNNNGNNHSSNSSSSSTAAWSSGSWGVGGHANPSPPEMAACVMGPAIGVVGSSYPSSSLWWHDLAWGLLLIWVGMELAFYCVIQYVLVPQLNRVRRPPPSAVDGKESMLRVLSTVHRLQHVYGFEEFFRGWFKGTPMHHLREDNVKDFLGWTTYHKRWGRLSEEEQASVEHVMGVMRGKYGLCFEEGYNPKCKFVAMNLEPLTFVHRPLLFYLTIKAVQSVGGVVLQWQGFRRYYTRQGVRYWYRRATHRHRHHHHHHHQHHHHQHNQPQNNNSTSSTTKTPPPPPLSARARRNTNSSFNSTTFNFNLTTSTQSFATSHTNSTQSFLNTITTTQRGQHQHHDSPVEGGGAAPPSSFSCCQACADLQHQRMPLVFFHGISPGLCVYLSLIARLMTRDRPCVLVEIPHVSMLLHFQASRKDMMVTAMKDIVKRHDLKAMAVAGHSFGSIVAGWVTSALPDVVKQLILIDPVCLLLCFPDVAFNFLYRQPVTSLGRFIKMAFGIAKELTVSYALRRNFWWHENILWLEDVRCPVLVALSEHDGIAPIRAVREYVLQLQQQQQQQQVAAAGGGGWVLREEGEEQQAAAAAAAAVQEDSNSGSTGIGNGLSSSRSRRRSSISISSSSGRRGGSSGGGIMPMMPSGGTSSSSSSSSSKGEVGGGPVDAQVMVWQGFTHGTVLFSARAQRQLVAAMKDQARKHVQLPPPTPRVA